MACRDQPITCREKIADRYGLTPNKRKSWQFEGPCPNCHHRGFSITAPDQQPNAPRHIWWCNCHRCKCPPELVRAAMLTDGIDTDCLGSYKRTSAASSPADPATVLRAAMREVLADDKIRALADLKLRMLEAIEGKPAPGDWDGFVAFAERAGVSRSKRYDTAARWGRSATAVGTSPDESVSSDCRSDSKSAVPKRDNGHKEHLNDKARPETRPGRFAANAGSPVSGNQAKPDTRRSETVLSQMSEVPLRDSGHWRINQA